MGRHFGCMYFAGCYSEFERCFSKQFYFSKWNDVINCFTMEILIETFGDIDVDG